MRQYDSLPGPGVRPVDPTTRSLLATLALLAAFPLALWALQEPVSAALLLAAGVAAYVTARLAATAP